MHISPALAWSIIGVILIIMEVLHLSFVLCFFGVGALFVALTTWIGLTPGIYTQLITFSLSSIILTFLLRKTAKNLFAGTKDKQPDYIGEKVQVVKAIHPGSEGAVTYRGSDWIAFSDSIKTFQEGDMVIIVSIDGIRLKIKHIEEI